MELVRTAREFVELDTWLEKVGQLAPLIATYREASERERRMPRPLFQAIREAGFMRMLMPRGLGGAGCGVSTALQVYEEFARHDGATGWNVMILFSSPLFGDYLAEDAAREIFGDGEAVIAGNLGPDGRATPGAGGYRVSGRWAFASGCHNATWFIGGCSVGAGGERDRSGMALERVLVLMPAAECRILDTWHTAGLRGTGSHDIVAEGVFVPSDHTFGWDRLMTGPEARTGVGYPYPFETLGRSGPAAVAFGIARDAIDSFKELATAKILKRGLGNLGSRHTVHEKVGLAEALLRSSRSYTYEALRDVLTTPSPLGLKNLQLATAFAVQNAIRAVDLVFECAGGSSLYETSRLERCFRDIHMISHHFAVSPLNLEMAGEYLLKREATAGTDGEPPQ